ncbi:MAG: hypothetical protein FD149_2269 [Rhodospirillaceae bacterium]|nr:MAG: hypothetical protein FD149_2269 [Rhodospirillaceae bacterium]
MSSPMLSQILTASRLTDGRVVYFTETGQWSEQILEALFVAGPEAETTLLAQGRQGVAFRQVVDPYLIEVVRAGKDDPLPVRLRERIRAFGPTVYPPPRALIAKDARHVPV